MKTPTVTFYCELDSARLIDLFSSPRLFDSLLWLKAKISLGLLDLSHERAKIVQNLNLKGIPVIGWLLLPKEEGYWFNIENLNQAKARYDAFQEWTKKYNLQWHAIGLDIEPDINDITLILDKKPAIFHKVFRRVIDRKSYYRSVDGYRLLVNQIRSDGYFVESYQIPVIADDRKAHSTLICRIGGLVDLQVDREVWMLYSSIFRPFGIGILGSYAPEAKAIGIGVTGGGVEIDLGSQKPLNWQEFERDLRLAWNWCDDIYIFSLEGCVKHDYLSKLVDFEWDRPIILPDLKITSVNRWRSIIQSILWLIAHFWILAIGLFSIFGFLKILSILYKNKAKQ